MHHSHVTGSSLHSVARALVLGAMLMAVGCGGCGGAKVPTQQSSTDDAAEDHDDSAEATMPDDASSVSGPDATTQGPVDRPDDGCFLQISAGGSHTCVVKADGTLWCWGDNALGQLGLGTTDSAKPTATQVAALSDDVEHVATGDLFTCAIRSDGTAWCWGRNNHGQLGDGTYVDRSDPAMVTALGNDVAQLSVGSWAACAVKENRSAWCWGYGPMIGVGLPAHESGVEPTQVAALGSQVDHVSVAGASHVCAVKVDGTLWCWGRNGHGQLGDGTTDDQLEPIQVANVGNDVVQVATRSSGTCVIKTDGSIWCWGRNLHGQVGDGTDGPSNTPRLLPVRIQALDANGLELSAGPTHACARTSDHDVFCWGKNQFGTIGDGHIDTTCESGAEWECSMNRAEPVPVTGLDDGVSQISVGTAHACVIMQDDTIWCWGGNTSGALGDGTTEGDECGDELNVGACRPSPVRAHVDCP